MREMYAASKITGRRPQPLRARLTRGVTVMAALVASTALFSCLASTQEEVSLGAQYSAEINKQLPLITDPLITGYLTKIGDSIARVADARSLQWHFFLVDQAEVNAFAVPGGYIYVNRGLIERSATLSELVGVIGHEIGHVTQRHSMKQMAAVQQTNVGLSIACILSPQLCQSDVAAAAVQIGATGVFAKFSRDDEREADRVAVDYSVRARYDPRGIPSMFRTLLAERERRPGALDAMFSTHPLAEDRVTASDALIASYDPALIATLTVDTREFQQFKTRLKAMPPSPVLKARF